MSKKLKIGAYLRPAVYNHVFDTKNIDLFKKNQQVYYKELDNSIRGPYRIDQPSFFASEEYNNLLENLEKKRVYVLDSIRYKESVLVSLPLQQAKIQDLLGYNHTNGLIEHTVFYIIKKEKVSGPFVVTAHTNIVDVTKFIDSEQFFILDKISNLKILQPITTAEAV